MPTPKPNFKEFMRFINPEIPEEKLDFLAAKFNNLSPFAQARFRILAQSSLYGAVEEVLTMDAERKAKDAKPKKD